MIRISKIRTLKLAAMALSIFSGFMTGSMVWARISDDLLPDLSEPPALISYYKTPAR